ncbi:hypothetical protein [Pedobacter sp. FW305-3-2-15-E-R2A2]|jgi:hypothetical protein
MEQITKTAFNKQAFSPIPFKAYEVIKKVIKYSIYIALFYFAYEGFMAWE